MLGRKEVHPVDPALPRGLRIIGGTCGVAMVIVGGVAVFITDNTTGSASLVVAGSIAGLLAIFANNIQSVDIGGIRVGLAEAARRTWVAAETAELEGRPEEAAVLRNQAGQMLDDVIDPIARQYERIRREQPRGTARTAELYRLLTDRTTEQLLTEQYPDRASVESLYDSGRRGDRAIALHLMTLHPETASPRVLLDCLKHVERGNEQFHALKAIQSALDHGVLPESERSDLLYAIQEALTQEPWGGDSDRGRLARMIYQRHGVSGTS